MAWGTRKHIGNWQWHIYQTGGDWRWSPSKIQTRPKRKMFESLKQKKKKYNVFTNGGLQVFTVPSFLLSRLWCCRKSKYEYAAIFNAWSGLEIGGGKEVRKEHSSNNGKTDERKKFRTRGVKSDNKDGRTDGHWWWEWVSGFFRRKAAAVYSCK
jgi:hypothetical protein